MIKRKVSNKMRLVRPADALLPLAFLVAEIMGRGFLADEVFLSYMAVKLLGLASSCGARIAFATQPSIRNVRGSVKTALLLQVFGGLLALGIYLVAFGGSLRGLPPALIGIGVLLNIEHVFSEYLYATGDGRSAAMCRTITSVLMTAGLLLATPADYNHPNDVQMLWLVGAAGLSALIAVVIGLAIGGPLRGKMNDQVFRCAPRAMLYTAAILSLIFCQPSRPVTSAPLFAGLALYELCKTPFRRSAMESRTFNRALLIVCAVCGAGYGLLNIPDVQALVQAILPIRDFYYDILATFLMLILSSALSFVLFGNVRRRGE